MAMTNPQLANKILHHKVQNVISKNNIHVIIRQFFFTSASALRHPIKNLSIPVTGTLDAHRGCAVFILCEKLVVICEISQTWWVRDRKWKSVAECASPTHSVLYHWLPYGCLSSLNIYIVTACQRNHKRAREDTLINVFNICMIISIGEEPTGRLASSGQLVCVQLQFCDVVLN